MGSLRGFWEDDRIVLYSNYGDGYITLCMCQNSQKCALLKVNFAVCKFKNKF